MCRGAEVQVQRSRHKICRCNCVICSLDAEVEVHYAGAAPARSSEVVLPRPSLLGSAAQVVHPPVQGLGGGEHLGRQGGGRQEEGGGKEGEIGRTR